MKNMHRVLVAIAAMFVANHALATPVLPENTAITGYPTSLFGYDAALNDYVSGGVSAVNDQNIEFLTDDFALALDFQSDGILRLFDNLGTGDDLFNYTFRFSFADLTGPLSNILLRDASALTAGELLFSIVDRNTFEVSLHDVQFDAGFSHADLDIAVDEPSMLVLLMLGLVGVFCARRANSVRYAAVAP